MSVHDAPFFGNSEHTINACNKKELLTGIEPVTPSLPRKCSTSEPQQLFYYRTILYQRKDSLSNKNWILSVKYGKILNK